MDVIQPTRVDAVAHRYSQADDETFLGLDFQLFLVRELFRIGWDGCVKDSVPYPIHFDLLKKREG